jgi:hypothetical protein
LTTELENLKGDLKVRVIAGSFEQTSKVLSDFKGQLPVDASMKQISIKLGEGESDWLLISIAPLNCSNRSCREYSSVIIKILGVFGSRVFERE